MRIYRFDSQQSPFTLKNKIVLILFSIIGLCLLFFFAFTAFIVAAVLTVVGFLVNLIQGYFKKEIPGSENSSRPARPYRPPPRSDDDIIDI